MTFKLLRFLAGFMIPVIVGGAILVRDSKEKLMTRVVYSEAATQSDPERELVAKAISNRVKSKDYPSNVRDVVYQKNNFSCIGSNNWRESKFKIFRNDYEERVFQECRQTVKNILKGKRLRIHREDELIAYTHGIDKPNDRYWNSLEEVCEVGDMNVYAPKN